MIATTTIINITISTITNAIIAVATISATHQHSAAEVFSRMSKIAQMMVARVRSLYSRTHRPFNDSELEACRRVDGTKFLNCLNPGIRVSSNYVDDKEAADLLSCANSLKLQYSFSSSEAQDVVAIVDGIHTPIDLKIESLRVTGRPEIPTQNHAPWGYGDHFKIEDVPGPLLNLAKKIENDRINFGHLKPQSLRDITINYRTHSMFKLDPHCDPPSDGENVFILGLQSDCVLTFTPPDAIEGSRLSLEAGLYKGGGTMRTTADAIALRSWTDHDIDVLMKKNSLVHFTGPAKTLWKHAIRIGLDVGEPHNGICDWFGDLDHLVKRNPQRISVVFAFQ